jgi:hypothetical protein
MKQRFFQLQVNHGVISREDHSDELAVTGDTDRLIELAQDQAQIFSDVAYAEDFHGSRRTLILNR